VLTRRGWTSASGLERVADSDDRFIFPTPLAPGAIPLRRSPAPSPRTPSMTRDWKIAAGAAVVLHALALLIFRSEAPAAENPPRHHFELAIMPTPVLAESVARPEPPPVRTAEPEPLASAVPALPRLEEPIAALAAPAPAPALVQPASVLRSPLLSSPDTARLGTTGTEYPRHEQIPGGGSIADLRGLGVARPVYRHNPQPAYPASARRRRQQGSVLLSVWVRPDGKPESLAIITSSGTEALDEAAVRAVADWEFEPARQDGRRVGSQVEVPIAFTLGD
jgi:protein TonB